MSRDLNFDGYWEGEAVYSCDNCQKEHKFRFDDETEAKNAKEHRATLRQRFGWITTKVEGVWIDVCCEKCRNDYIRRNTI